MTADLTEADRARLSRAGIAPLSTERGLELLESARGLGEAQAVALPLQRGALRQLARAGLLPPLFSRLAPVGRGRSEVARDSLARRLAGIPEEEHEALALNLVREHVAEILGHPSAAAVDPEASFQDLGFDSLGAVELRNRLVQATDIQLEATLIFDHPNSEAVARYLLAKVDPAGGGDPGLDPEEAEVRKLLASVPVARLRESGVLDMVRALSGDASSDAEENGKESEIDTMDIDDLVRQTLESSEVGEA